MSHVLALIRRQFLESRMSSIVAALATSATIGAVHAWFPGPAAVSEASALAISVLSALWTLYFASDSFAGDAASGRLATLSTLPISTRALWASRLGFVALASLAQLVWAIAVGYGAQFAFGDARSLEHFDDALRSYAPWAFALPVLASAAMLASLVVESALAALVGSLVLLGGLAAVFAPLARVLAVAGVDVRPSAGIAATGAMLLALMVLALGAHSFSRGQRRLGGRRVRAFHAAWPLGVVLCVAGVATAAEHRRRVSVELESPRAVMDSASASMDGAYIALAVRNLLLSGDGSPANVWLLDLETGRRELLARPGMLLDDRYLRYSLPWSSEKPLRVVQNDLLDFRDLNSLIEVTPGSASWTVNKLPANAGVLGSWLATRAVPAWASVERKHDKRGGFSTIVVWTERGIERVFPDTLPLHQVLPTSVAGGVLWLRQRELIHQDMDSGAETLVLRGEGRTRMSPSRSGSAVLVSTEVAYTAVDATTGAVLHAPWPSKGWRVTWSDANDDARVVQLRAIGRPDVPSRIIDLDRGVQFEIDPDRTQPFLLRIAQRGYVFVRADGDLVLVGLQGRLVKVLVQR